MQKHKGFSVPLTLLVVIIAALFVIISYNNLNHSPEKQNPIYKNVITTSKGSNIILESPSQPSVLDNNKKNINSTNWGIFKSQLGFSFQYPIDWGDPHEEILTAAESGDGVSGKSYLLKFNKNNEIWASGRSKDFSAGRGAVREDFSGHDERGLGVVSYLDIVAPGCFNMGTMDTFEGTIEFNLPGKEITGVRFRMPILSHDDLSKIIKKFGLPTYKIGSTDIIKENCYEESGIDLFEEQKKIGTAIKKYILEKQELDQESLYNLEIFEKISKSAVVL